ncbi:nitronate monooxygenase [Endozoicomonas gorgoniicola]|uniref:Nitronate monooxygenase n=1 Tax=Endozoicomonas gorgoniicola TaxID=1234144 RepID=A0ABT3MSK9_9GAMM|nr:nitronate monooxygenase [Endozoicomonas gorgoniicola]MCW7552371.1 nitronate monooxygenase [Endozoicomonas gorgoniicola]
MKNRICEVLNIEKPIIQAPMLWVTSAEMVAAVSEAGGLGTYGFNGGYDTKVTSVEETAERMRTQIRKIKKLTNKPFAFNYVLPFDGIDFFGDACLQVAIEEEVMHVVAAGYVTESAVKKLKDYGMKVIARPVNPTIEQAQLAERAGADVIVATGFDEGGSAPMNTLGTMSIVPVIADSVDIPVLAAGGIVDSRGVKASFALGAEGVFVGTAFITSEESPASQITKDAIIKFESEETVTLKTAYGHERCLTTQSVTDYMENQTAELKDNEAIVEKITQTFLDGFIKGRLDKGFISVSAAVSLIKEIKTCKEIVSDLYSGVPVAV